MGDTKLTFPKAPFPIALRIWKWSKSTAGGKNRNVVLQLAVAIGDHSVHVAETIHAPRSNLSCDLLQLGAAQSAIRTPSSSPGRRLTRPVEVYVRFSREAAAHGRSPHVSTALETLQLASPTCIPRTDVPGALSAQGDRTPPTTRRPASDVFLRRLAKLGLAAAARAKLCCLATLLQTSAHFSRAPKQLNCGRADREEVKLWSVQ